MVNPEPLLTSATKQYLLIKKEIYITRRIRKPKRQNCGFGILAFYSHRDIKGD